MWTDDDPADNDSPPGELSGDEPVEVPMPEEDEDVDDEEPSPEDLSFCELCGATENEDEELVRCEECGRLHCSACGQIDDEGAPYCSECCDEVGEE